MSYNSQHLPDNIKKFSQKKFKGLFNDFLDLFDTPTKYTKTGDILVVNDEANGLEFADFAAKLNNLFTQQGNIGYALAKIYRHSFTNVASIVIQHNFNSQLLVYKIYDNNGIEVIPGSVQIIDSNNIKFTFKPNMSGSIILVSD